MRSLRESRGLGDVIASATAGVGIDPCADCKERQKRLNSAVPFRRRKKTR